MRYPLISLSLAAGGEGGKVDQRLSVSNWRSRTEVERRARDKLGVALYPFLDVGYERDYLKAFEAARHANKVLLAVVLWGALDDASC